VGTTEDLERIEVYRDGASSFSCGCPKPRLCSPTCSLAGVSLLCLALVSWANTALTRSLRAQLLPAAQHAPALQYSYPKLPPPQHNPLGRTLNPSQDPGGRHDTVHASLPRGDSERRRHGYNCGQNPTMRIGIHWTVGTISQD
jgi:hypothetical protein